MWQPNSEKMLLDDLWYSSLIIVVKFPIKSIVKMYKKEALSTCFFAFLPKIEVLKSFIFSICVFYYKLKK